MKRVKIGGLVAAVAVVACGGDAGTSGPDYPACGSADSEQLGLLSSAPDVGALHALARSYDRVHDGVNAAATGLAQDLTIVPMQTAVIEAFAAGDDAPGESIETHQGTTLDALIAGQGKATGAFAGVSAAADAMRYAVLRSEGAPCEQIDAARAQLVRAMDGLHLVTAITGVPGVLARAVVRKDLPHTITTTPLFDGVGQPLPTEKDNGTWREDNSGGTYPDYIWEDSASRDQVVGWAMAYATVWEVIRQDDTIDDAIKSRLQTDATAIGSALATVRPSGYDLEIPDADGRTTFHGYIHEFSWERGYIPGVPNGAHSAMALGIVAAFVYAAEDPALHAYLHDDLINERRLHEAVRDSLLIDLGWASNHSAFNMGFVGIWLAHRYLDDALGRGVLLEGLEKVYRGQLNHPPQEWGQTLFDFIYAISRTGKSAYSEPSEALDAEAVARGLPTLAGFGSMPRWDVPLTNCDQTEIDAGMCTLGDGTQVRLLGNVGWNDVLISETVVPMGTRPASNYVWRTTPYRVNGGGSGTSLPNGADFRFAYWLGRWGVQ